MNTLAIYPPSLAVASLFPGDFSIDWVLELTQKKASEVIQDLEDGIQEGSLTKKRPGLYAFNDPQRRQHYLESLTEHDKELLNRYIVKILLLDIKDSDRRVQALAYHLLQLTNDHDGCLWLLKAGDSYLRSFKNEMALCCYRKVLDDLLLQRGREADELFTDTAVKYSKVSTARQDTTTVLSILQEAMKRARRWNDQCNQSLLEMHMAKNEWLRGQYDNALRRFNKGWKMAKDLNNPKLLRSATSFNTFFFYWQGLFKDAVHCYEESVPGVDKFPRGGFPILAAQVAAYCYSQVGQETHGLGMMDAIRKQCLETGNRYLAATAGSGMAAVMIDLRRVDDALDLLEQSIAEASKEKNDWVWIRGNLMRAFIHFLKEDYDASLLYLKDFLRDSKRVHVVLRSYTYFMELCWAMETGKLPSQPGVSLEKEIELMIDSQNIFMKGVAYRYKGLLQKRQSLPPQRVIESLNLSLKHLERTGQQRAIAQTQAELARQYLALGKEKLAQATAQTACNILGSANQALIPEDLRPLIKQPSSSHDLLKEILKLGRDVVTIKDDKELIQQILVTANRLTGAERAAIFLHDQERGEERFRLRGSKNLTSEEINHPSFRSSMGLINQVIADGKGRIVTSKPPQRGQGQSEDVIRSRICVPMTLRNKVAGVLYHDNRLLSSAFEESDLELLSYFAAQAAFAIDNARAYQEIRRLNQKLTQEKLYYEEQQVKRLHFDEIVGNSPPMIQVLAQVEQVAATACTVLILGETGVGKELVARAIHKNSPRHDKPFIRVLCSALPEILLPSELFGHEKGAFTGAIGRRAGRFELADGGTLFLDEIGELSFEMQVSLLRVLQTREFERVGGTETIRSDFRLVAATNRDLEEGVRRGNFRLDLFHRLNVFPIKVPPLRERREDIGLLANHFLEIHASKSGEPVMQLRNADLAKLLQYDWPGNVRELENIIERGILLGNGKDFRIPTLGLGHPSISKDAGGHTLRDNERRHILWALEQTGWKVRGKGGAAELLDINPSTLAFRMKKLEITRPANGARK
ncbi:MAG: sigma 54-interacting transcriptional regulator [Thermodesulfobacteriota bacterium]